MAQAIESDWVARFADEVIAEADRRAPGKTIVCASGLSPSGPVHLGNQRELMTPHLVADEIRRRGRDVRHILSWDDFDRFRKVPGRRRPLLGRAHRQAVDRGARRPRAVNTPTGPSTSRRP